MERGDFRIFILDNHRPVHLANIYSRHQVVVFDDETEIRDDEQYTKGEANYVPSDGSTVGSTVSEGDSGSDNDDDDGSDGGEDEDGNFSDEEQRRTNKNNNNNNEDDEDEQDERDFEARMQGEEEAEEVNDVDEEAGRKTVGKDDISAAFGDEDDDADGEGEGEDVAKSDNEEDAENNNNDNDNDNDKTVAYDDEMAGSVGSSGTPPTGGNNNNAARKRKAQDSANASSSSSSSGRGGKKSPVGMALASPSGGGELDQTVVHPYAAATEMEEEEEEEEVGEEEGMRQRQNNRQERERADSDAESEDGERVVVRSRRRKTAEEVAVQEKKQRRELLHQYYGRNIPFAAPTSVMMLNLVGGKFGNHVPLDLLWQAVLGVTDQHQRGTMSQNEYVEFCEHLKLKLSDHLLANRDHRYTVQNNGDPNNDGVASETTIVVPGSMAGNIEEGKEYRFFLHRHWSLFDAMSHSPYIASKLRCWNLEGTNRLQELLAKMGVPLQQCKQEFSFITPSLRSHFRQQISSESTKAEFNLQAPDVLFDSFFRYNSFRNPVAAADVVHAATALFEMYGEETFSTAKDRENRGETGNGNGNAHAPSSSSANTAGGAVTRVRPVVEKKSSVTAFNEAYDCLGMRSEGDSDGLLKKGIKAALDIQRSIVKKVSVLMDGRDSIRVFNRLYYAYLSSASSSGPRGSAGAGGIGGNGGRGGGGGSMSRPAAAADDSEMEHTFGRANVLLRLGHFIMNIKRNLPKKDGGWTGSRLLPLILLSEKLDGSFIVAGISPLNDCEGLVDRTADEYQQQNHGRLNILTNFRQFFKQAAQETNARWLHNSFDANIIEVDKDDVQEFLGNLDYVLKKATPQARE
jgi:hypothetical protein